jgi:hypothetical protein
MKKILKKLHFFPRLAYPILIMTFFFFVLNMMSGYYSTKKTKQRQIKFISNNEAELNYDRSNFDFKELTQIKCDYQIENDKSKCIFLIM